jgi:hypothetical protein
VVRQVKLMSPNGGWWKCAVFHVSSVSRLARRLRLGVRTASVEDIYMPLLVECALRVLAICITRLLLGTRPTKQSRALPGTPPRNDIEAYEGKKRRDRLYPRLRFDGTPNGICLSGSMHCRSRLKRVSLKPRRSAVPLSTRKCTMPDPCTDRTARTSALHLRHPLFDDTRNPSSRPSPRACAVCSRQNNLPGQLPEIGSRVPSCSRNPPSQRLSSRLERRRVLA